MSELLAGPEKKSALLGKTLLPECRTLLRRDLMCSKAIWKSQKLFTLADMAKILPNVSSPLSVQYHMSSMYNICTSNRFIYLSVQSKAEMKPFASPVCHMKGLSKTEALILLCLLRFQL